MHSNGSNRLILPNKGPLLPNLAPQGGFKIGLTPVGLQVTAFIGEHELPMQLNAEQATQLGVSLISAAAIQQQAAQQTPAPDPLAHEHTPPRIAID